MLNEKVHDFDIKRLDSTGVPPLSTFCE